MFANKKNMQERHLDRLRYFEESANSAQEYYIDYLKNFISIDSETNILEVGCGEGGNLLPFAKAGCQVTGIDRSSTRISQAKDFFIRFGQNGNFITSDFFNIEVSIHKHLYDIILVHDVIEHVEEKERFMAHLKSFLTHKGVVFWGFPAWQMPFGGHQQICHHKICSKLPFIHLLPSFLYRTLLKAFGENQACIDELMEIKRCGVTIERFEELLKINGYKISGRILWLINPHYMQKFKLRPRKLNKSLSQIRYLRNFFCTSCFYITNIIPKDVEKN